MNFIKAFKKARQILREEAELRKNLRAIRKADLSYECLQKLIENVANSINGVGIDVYFADGTKMEIRPVSRNEIGFRSFQEKWRDRNKQSLIYYRGVNIYEKDKCGIQDCEYGYWRVLYRKQCGR